MRINVLIILTLMLPGLIFSLTHTVKLDGSGDFASIQAAVDASASGDTILVYPGRYYENVIIQTNGINLFSLEALTHNPVYIDSTIIDGNHTESCVRVRRNIHNICIQGITLTNGLTIGGAGGIGLSTNSSSVLINLRICNNTAAVGGGIDFGAATVVLSGVEIYDNYALHLGGGINAGSGEGYISTITFDPVNRCSIYNNRSSAGQDIFIQDAESDLNVYLDTFSVAVPTDYYATYISEGLGNYQMHFDILNAHHQEIDSDLYVSPDGDDANDGLSPSSPLRTIQEGIYRIAADSLSQNTVHLLSGTYSRTDNDQVFPIALKSWVKVQGSGMDTTVVVGEPHPLIPAGYDVVFLTTCQEMISLSNMSITTMNTNNGNAISGSGNGSLNLSNLRLYDIHPEYVSTIWVWLGNVHDSIWNNVIIEDIVTSNMGIVYVGGQMSGTISNCVFKNAISTYTSASVGGFPLISIKGDRDLTFENCEFSNLTMYDDCSNFMQIFGVQFPQQHNNFSFKNCLFSNNSSQGGGIIVGSSNYSNVNFTNCTFAGNEGDAYTLKVNGNVNITNSIFDNETPYQIQINPMDGYETTTLTLDYSCIKDGISGIQQAPGNTINFLPTSINSDPLFAGGTDIYDPLFYSLSELSPCINSGTPDTTGLNLPPYDFAGNWRIWDERIDMGCFEFGSEPWVSNDDPIVPEVSEITLVAYPNPFRTTTNIKILVPVEYNNRWTGNSVVCIDIFNIKGQKVKTFSFDPGSSLDQGIVWDGRDHYENNCASGLYFINLILDGKQVVNKKVTLIK